MHCAGKLQMFGYQPCEIISGRVSSYQLMGIKLKASICLTEDITLQIHQSGPWLESEGKVKPAQKHRLLCGVPVQRSTRCERGTEVPVGWNCLFSGHRWSPICKRHTPLATFPARVKTCCLSTLVPSPPCDTQHAFVPGRIMRTDLFSGCETSRLSGSQPLRSGFYQSALSPKQLALSYPVLRGHWRPCNVFTSFGFAEWLHEAFVLWVQLPLGRRLSCGHQPTLMPMGSISPGDKTCTGVLHPPLPKLFFFFQDNLYSRSALTAYDNDNREQGLLSKISGLAPTTSPVMVPTSDIP